MWTDAWWFPLAALITVSFVFVVVAGVLPTKGRTALGGSIIILLTAASIFAYGYSVFYLPAVNYIPYADCLGAPYAVC